VDDDGDPISRYPSITPQSPTKQLNEKHVSYFILVAKALLIVDFIFYFQALSRSQTKEEAYFYNLVVWERTETRPAWHDQHGGYRYH
jgi:hypothetical protein